MFTAHRYPAVSRHRCGIVPAANPQPGPPVPWESTARRRRHAVGTVSTGDELVISCPVVGRRHRSSMLPDTAETTGPRRSTPRASSGRGRAATVPGGGDAVHASCGGAISENIRPARFDPPVHATQSIRSAVRHCRPATTFPSDDL